MASGVKYRLAAYVIDVVWSTGCVIMGHMNYRVRRCEYCTYVKKQQQKNTHTRTRIHARAHTHTHKRTNTKTTKQITTGMHTQTRKQTQ